MGLFCAPQAITADAAAHSQQSHSLPMPMLQAVRDASVGCPQITPSPQHMAGGVAAAEASVALQGAEGTEDGSPEGHAQAILTLSLPVLSKGTYSPYAFITVD